MCWYKLQIKWITEKYFLEAQEIKIKILADLHSSDLLITDFLCNSLLDLEDGCEASLQFRASYILRDFPDRFLWKLVNLKRTNWAVEDIKRRTA
jgi:hypothetical protein